MEKGSDFAVLTSDNPRSEDPLAIMNDAWSGYKSPVQNLWPNQIDARQLRSLYGSADPETSCCWPAKGMRRSRSPEEGTVPFDDVEVARENLKALGFECKKCDRRDRQERLHESALSRE